ncbi:MAG: SGNH/GDSL hydrolase family protein [Lachnospiraceae bacterium]|nr:SGNH/GDSL hydrolase family protein [Lachnospiraceae bacterium]
MKNIVRLIATVMVFSILGSSVPVYSEPEEMPDGVIFDSEYYAEKYPDVVEVLGTNDTTALYTHYRTYGRFEGRFPTKEREETASVNRVSVNSAEKKKNVSDNDIRRYYSRSVFIGDSVMTGYKMYVNYYESLASGAFFLATNSYATFHALKEDSNLHPMFQGKKQPVWKSVSSMDVDRVFIMLGTNDLICWDVDRTSSGITELAMRIQDEIPGMEINLVSMTPAYPGASRNCLTNENINILNAKLMDIAEEHNWGYVDINTPLKCGGNALPPELCSDKLIHETSAAYGIWDKEFEVYAKEQLQLPESTKRVPASGRLSLRTRL